MRRKKRGFARFLRMKTVLALNLALLGMVGWGFMGEYGRGRDLQGEIDALKQNAEDMQTRNLELAEMRERFAGEGQLEREARLKLNLMLPGEQVVVIKDEGTQTAPASDDTGVPAPQQARKERSAGNARRWLDHLFGRDGPETLP